MSYYGGTVTVAGRDLITSLMAGETIEFTRIVVGSGRMPEGVEPIDMTDLVNPIAEATSTIPVVENGVMYMTVEYRNDMNGGLQEGFWLDEFAVYAKTENRPEVMLYFATLGDSPQPVNAYKDGRVDVRRYPISIALELDADIEVSYNPGAFITAGEAEELIGSMVKEAVSGVGSANIFDITIPSAGWSWWEEESGGQDFIGMDEYRYYLDLPVADATEDQFPSVALHKSALEAAKYAGLCPTVQTLDGFIRFWAKNEPDADMAATVALLSRGSGGGSSGGGGEHYVLPTATETVLGGVKIGKGIKVANDGTITSDAKVPPEDLATEDDTSEMLDEVFGKDNGVNDAE